MFDRQSLHIALLVWGMIFSLIAALCMFMSKNFDREKRKWLILMQLSSAVLLVSDAVAWGYRGNPGKDAYYMVRISNFLVFLFSDIILFLFHGYLCGNLSGDGRRKMTGVFRVRAVYGIAVVGMFLVVVSQFTGLYYYFDAQNLYHRSTTYSISLILPLIGMLSDLSLLIQYRRKISRQMFVSMVSYILLPMTAAVILLFYYGISLINIAICISLILMFVVAMVEQNQMLAMHEKEAADLRISLLISQIAPHFIYNTLTTIEEMCETDPQMAKETVREFAEYLRGNLRSIEEMEPVPFEQELEHVHYYLAIEQKRFANRIRVAYDIREKDFLIPSLTLQPLVENAVKHGLCKKRGGGTVWIRTERQENAVHVYVLDDGAGFDPAKAMDTACGHIGLKNVTNRVRTMCGGTVAVKSVPGKGTKAEIILPQQQ